MQIVTFPSSFIDAYLAEARQIMESGQVAEGKYFRELSNTYVPGKLSLPVTSGGAAMLALLAYQKHVRGRNLALIQSNTAPRLHGARAVRHGDQRSRLELRGLFEHERRRAGAHASRRDGQGFGGCGVFSDRWLLGAFVPAHRRDLPACRRAADRRWRPRSLPRSRGCTARRGHRVLILCEKILPAGEGGLVTTADSETHVWVRRFLMYDRFQNKISVGINLRAGELTAALIHRLMTTTALVQHFKGDRIAVALAYEAVCRQHGIRYLVPGAPATTTDTNS